MELGAGSWSQRWCGRRPLTPSRQVLAAAGPLLQCAAVKEQLLLVRALGSLQQLPLWWTASRGAFPAPSVTCTALLKHC